jgi:hypothetical protein
MAIDQTEWWLPVVGYEGYYEVSNLGRVRALERTLVYKNGTRRTHPTHPMSTSALVKGYRSVGLWKGNVGERLLVHRLVLEAFVGPCPVGQECRHGDGDRQNPALTNLSWGTPKQNGEDRVAHGKQARGEDHGSSKLTIEKVREIRALLGTLTQTEIAKRYGVGPSVISRINSGNAWVGID